MFVLCMAASHCNSLQSNVSLQPGIPEISPPVYNIYEIQFPCLSAPSIFCQQTSCFGFCTAKCTLDPLYTMLELVKMCLVVKGITMDVVWYLITVAYMQYIYTQEPEKEVPFYCYILPVHSLILVVCYIYK